MFTTIEKLRASSAMPSRVNVLQTFMRKTPGFTDKTPIPIYAILDSNGAADASWVANNDRVTQLEMSGQKVKASGTKSEIAAKIDLILDEGKSKQECVVKLKSEIYGEIAAMPIPKAKKETPKKGIKTPNATTIAAMQECTAMHEARSKDDAQKKPTKAKSPVSSVLSTGSLPVTLDVRRTMDKFKKYGKVHVGKITGKQHEERVTIAIYVTVPASHELVGLASS
jgi:hypothetical protein